MIKQNINASRNKAYGENIYDFKNIKNIKNIVNLKIIMHLII